MFYWRSEWDAISGSTVRGDLVITADPYGQFLKCPKPSLTGNLTLLRQAKDARRITANAYYFIWIFYPGWDRCPSSFIASFRTTQRRYLFLRISDTGLKVGEIIDSTLKQITTIKLAYGALITWPPWYAFPSTAVHDSAVTNWLPIVCFNYSPGCIKYVIKVR